MIYIIIYKAYYLTIIIVYTIDFHVFKTCILPYSKNVILKQPILYFMDLEISILWITLKKCLLALESQGIQRFQIPTYPQHLSTFSRFLSTDFAYLSTEILSYPQENRVYSVFLTLFYTFLFTLCIFCKWYLFYCKTYHI